MMPCVRASEVISGALDKSVYKVSCFYGRAAPVAMPPHHRMRGHPRLLFNSEWNRQSPLTTTPFLLYAGKTCVGSGAGARRSA